MTQAALSETGNERIVAGGNFPPFEQAKSEIDDLYSEAKVWLDGGKVETQEQADTIATLLDLTRKAKKKADQFRKDENKPFDEGKAEVQGRYNPILKRADLIASTCKDAVLPFLAAQESAKREAERIAREEAEAAERAAQEAMQRSSGNIEERAEAEAALDAAKSATTNANKMAKDKGSAKGGDRAMSLRNRHSITITDLTVALRHYWTAGKHESEFHNLLMDIARKDVRSGAREIPGVQITEEKAAV